MKTTIADVLALAVIVNAAADGAFVRWLDEDDRILEGTARHIVVGPDHFGFLGHDEDVRDGFLRVTGTSGFEYALPVADLVIKVGRGEFVQKGAR